MKKKRLIDATDLVRRVLVERDKIPLEVVPRYNFGVPEPFRAGQAMRGGIRKALREIETSQTVDAVAVVRCKDCKYVLEKHYEEPGEPPYIKYLCDCPYGLSNRYGIDKNDFCSRGEKMDAEVRND